MFRNKEIRQFTIIITIISIIGIILGFIINFIAGILAIILAITLCTTFFVFTNSRYKSLAKISNEIDHVLHNDEHIYMGEATEGELSILNSELTKMTVRIREQNDELKKEKLHLADSLADIAHQLRTPLTSISLIVSLLETTSDENDRKVFLQEAEELLIQTDWLITSILKISRLDASIVMFQSDSVNIASLIQSSIRPFQISIELHNILIKTAIPDDAVIIGDAGWLSEAVQNILKNCIETLIEDGLIEITCNDNTLFTQITIHDNGKGFDTEDFPYIFDRFYRGKNQNATGYGIGLALCKMIITRQGGSITARNHTNGGALFDIRFPK